ncbi:hypothetical protein [Bacillus paranthracis]|uniref:hypothetical protein n=1 Tax=Bacillus paranthracis TaxID=2026186 RepID=UPI002DBF0B98|nr:hypothetical protein [Bacillus paranthracis]MEC1628672.1 hypothetical protein [Bacillus paranthracis]
MFLIFYLNVADKHINKLARNNGIKSRGRDRIEVLEELIQNGHKPKLDYLSMNFQYDGKYFTLCSTEEDFPNSSNTAKKFLSRLVAEKRITSQRIGEEWKPTLREEIQICGIKIEGESVYLKLVEGRKATIPSQDGYGNTQVLRAKKTVIVIHFDKDEPLIELRCSSTDQQKYMNYIREALGFAKPYKKWHAVPKLTKPIVNRLYAYLRAGVASRHILLPTSVGSVQFNGKKGVDLNGDKTYNDMLAAIAKLNIPTDDTMDESCYFTYQDHVSGLEYEATVQIDIKNSLFTFNQRIPDCVIKHVMDGVWTVSIQSDKAVVEQIASGN